MEMKFEIINCIILLWLYNMLTSWGAPRKRKTEMRQVKVYPIVIITAMYNIYVCITNETAILSVFVFIFSIYLRRGFSGCCFDILL